MKRAFAAIVATVAGLVLLLGFKTHSARQSAQPQPLATASNPPGPTTSPTSTPHHIRTHVHTHVCTTHCGKAFGVDGATAGPERDWICDSHTLRRRRSTRDV